MIFGNKALGDIITVKDTKTGLITFFNPKIKELEKPHKDQIIKFIESIKEQIA